MGIIFSKQDGGLSRTTAGTDGVCGMLFFLPAVPQAWGTSVRQIVDIEAAEDAGIVDVAATAVAHYHISEFFRLAGVGATLYVQCAVRATDDEDFSAIADMVDFSEGKIRMVGVYTQVALAQSDIPKLQAQANAAQQANTPLSAIVYAADISSVTDLSTLPNMRGTGVGAPNSPNVSVIVAQDGGGKGAALFGTLSKSVTCLGACMGVLAVASVNENIGWIKKFNLSDGSEMEVAAIANGRLRPNTATAEMLTNKGYIVAYKEVDIAGTYFNDAPTACPANSDYAYIEANRTMDKAIRGIRAALLPELRGTVYIDPDTGCLRADTIAYLQETANAPLVEMSKSGELSGYQAEIDPDQNILSTSVLDIKIRCVPTGVVRTLRINIGYTTTTV